MISWRTALAAALLLIASSGAAQSGWTGVGRTEVAGDGGRGTIVGREEQGFRREFMICVEGHAIRFLSGELRYRDGRTQSLRLSRMGSGDCSRASSLSGGNRDIASLDFTYEPASLQGARAIVEVYAR